MQIRAEIALKTRLIFCHRRLSFVVSDTVRQANDVHSTNAIKLRLKLNVAKH